MEGDGAGEDTSTAHRAVFVRRVREDAGATRASSEPGRRCGWREEAGFLVLVLGLVELPAEAALREQFLVQADLAQLALAHEKNGFGTLERQEAMSIQSATAAWVWLCAP